MINNEPFETPPTGLDLKAIYYALFRQKWKIIGLSVAGIVASVAVYFQNPPVYLSEAKVLVRYVLEREGRSLNPATRDSEIKSADSSGIITSELEILRSFDLANQVADVVGPEKIAPMVGGATNRMAAAALIARNLDVQAVGRSSTIRVVFRHTDPAVVQPVLHNLIDGYQKKHVEVHRVAGVVEEDLTRKTDELRTKLAKIDEELRNWTDKAGASSLDAANRAHVDQTSVLREEIFKAEAELAGRRVGLNELQGNTPKKTEEGTITPVTPPEDADRYRNIAAELESLRKTETNLLVQFTGDSTYVKSVRQQIGDFEKRKKKLEEDYPLLSKPIMNSFAAANPAVSSMDPAFESYRIRALEAQTNTLHSQLDTVVAEAAAIRKVEAKITELKREKEVLEANYRNYQTTLEQARLDQALGPGKVPNINVVQEPSPPTKDASKSLKPVAIALALGVLGGVGLALLSELVLDRSVRRPAEVKDKLHLPLFLTIPRMAPNGHARLAKKSAKRELPDPEMADIASASLAGLEAGADSKNPVEPWDAKHKLRVYYEALRDRLITHFEVNGMTHKPKLIAVTSCSGGAGVTSTAAGLAATLSETGDGNVLLVDMNQERGAAHPFHLGRPECGLLDALENDKRDPALIQEKLYMASMNDAANKLPRVLPRRFTHLVPKLKMSDYDYIIFDMPAISHTSITPKLAAFMDLVLLVIESEKTNRDVAEQANTLLAESKVSAKAVLNKYRSYVPRWLQEEL